MADIFISYASEDRERARALAEAFTARGWSVWFDREIPIGKSYTDVIEHELTTAGCVVVLWSAESVKSQWVCNEAREGLGRHVLVPVLMDPVKLPLEFRHLQTASLVDWEAGSDSPEFAKVERAIAGFVRGEGPPPAPAAPVAPKPRANRTMFIVLGAAALIAAVVIGFLVFDGGPEGGTGTTTDTTTAPVTEPTTAPVTDTTPTMTTTTEPDAPVSRVFSGVGRVVSGGRTQCTAFLVSRTRALTLGACVNRRGQSTVLQFGSTSRPIEYGFRVIESGADEISFALLALDATAARELVPIRLGRREASVGESVVVAHYGTTTPLEVDRSRIINVRHDGIVYELETKPGAMGAPLISSSGNELLGVHMGRDGRHPTLKRAIPTASMPETMVAKIR